MTVKLRCTLVGEADGYAFLETPRWPPLLFSLKPTASSTEVRQALLGSIDRVPSLAEDSENAEGPD